MTRRRSLEVTTESWDFREPFTITGYTFTTSDLLLVTISDNGATGCGEAAGVYYLKENAERMRADVEQVRAAIERGADRADLQELLPPGGARNALDCALWDLEAKLEGTTVWEMTGIEPRETKTVLTIGIGTPEAMGEAARTLDSDRIKVKLDSEQPVERLRAVREARPDAEIIVDINQGWDFEQLQSVAPVFAGLDVALIEQPLPRGGDAELEGYRSPVPLGADESCLGLADFEAAAARYQVINIKLDKTGGLTEALELAARAKARGIGLMVGNMMGTSLAMAPGFVVAQLCRFVDLDGPLFLKHDRDHAMTYTHGVVTKPARALWG
jgi:L-alanine-DL-glutamate epimerase-like enolase superfamily enzyme